MKAAVSILAVTVLIVAASGCKTGFYHTQTTWNEDGSIDRAVLQPGALPGDEKEWDGTTHSNELDHKFQGEIRDLPRLREGGYSVAWKNADTWEGLPQHYLKKAAESDAKSEFERTASRTDYGLVMEYQWREVLTDVVRLSDARQALVEATELGGDAAAGIVGEALGDGYDASELEGWITGDGRKWLLELFDVIYDAAVRREKDEDEIKKSIAAVCRRFGLNVTLRAEREDADEDELRRYLTELFRRAIRKTNGDAIDEPTLETLVGAITGEDKPRYKKLDDRLQDAINNYKAAWPGGSEALDAKVGPLMTRIFGVHGAILQAPEEFRFRMDVPGEIVETNGRIQKGGQVQWQFSGTDAWPRGFAMEVRSLDPQEKMLKILAGKKFQSTPRNLLRIVEIVGDDEPLQRTLRECHKKIASAPLEKFRDSLPEESDERGRVNKLLFLLKGPVKVR